jgi:hypothetical protein
LDSEKAFDKLEHRQILQVLQSTVNKAWQLGVLKHPLSDEFGGGYPIVQFVDDTFLIVAGRI